MRLVKRLWGVLISGGCKSVKSCFPSDATVEVQGRGAVRMADLAYGDKVLSVDRGSGARVFREVYLFGHRDGDTVQEYVSVRTAGGAVLQLSPRHYIPVCVHGCAAGEEGWAPGSAVLQPKYGSELRVGDVVLVAAAGGSASGLEPAAVVETWVSAAVGAFNPFVRGADLIVDGVVASPHSDWLLDGVTPAALRKHLPAVY